jgi:hypothetical protein
VIRFILPVLAAVALLAPTVAGAGPLARAAATCSDYSNQAEAQRAADTRDADGDGVYCESLPCPCLKPGSSTPRPHTTKPKAVVCGVERWNVKTTKDKRASLIKLNPVASSVDALRRMDVPVVGRHDPRITGVETTVYRVRAQLVAMKAEDDGDILLVIASRSNRSHTMIVEFPNTACLGGVGSTKKRKMVAARKALVQSCGSASDSTFRTLHGAVTIDGVGFVDIKHGQRGVAPNGIELHPVLRFSGGC